MSDLQRILAGAVVLWVVMEFATSPVEAHNGSVAMAVPVQGIVVDGDLSDRPSVYK
ncbi:MAG: hypothetical protein HY709_08160 [Candidatus Latescibacteria bacterium]|nr:hypothetical protein [Candidatus Latescibacterota bacterium]